MRYRVKDSIVRCPYPSCQTKPNQVIRRTSLTEGFCQSCQRKFHLKAQFETTADCRLSGKEHSFAKVNSLSFEGERCEICGVRGVGRCKKEGFDIK